MYKALVLNADYRPFKFVSWKRAIKMLYKQEDNGTKEAYALEYYDAYVLDSKERKHKLPAVIALNQYVKVANKKATYTKTNIYTRDGYRCQYCGEKFARDSLTVDHVVPKSRWKRLGNHGTSSIFTNVVTACRKCNSAKGDRTCEECNMFPINEPKDVTKSQAFFNRFLTEKIPEEWEDYVNEYR